MADDEEAVMFACRSFVFCAPDLHQSLEQLLEKSEVGMSTPVHVVATSLNTYRASRAVLSDKRDTSSHISSRLLPLQKCMG